MPICVTIIDLSGKPRSIVYEQVTLNIGRSSGNEVRLDPVADTHVSRRHGKIYKSSDGKWYYEDLESKHGSFRGDLRIQNPLRIFDGDVITLGDLGTAVSVSLPVPRITGEGGTHLRIPRGKIIHFPLVFSEDFYGRFRSYEKISEGGYGEVWRAEPIDGGPAVAVKLMHPEFLLSDELQEADRSSLVRRFTREAEVTKLLSESGAPGIVKVHEWGDNPDKDFLYIIQDFVEGQSLAKMILRRPMMEQSQACHLLCQVAGSLNAAHNFAWTDETGTAHKSVVHRDIKPSNILIEEESDKAWLIDFGVAGIQEGGERLTATHVAIGSIHFLPQEAMFQSTMTPSMDLWAFAVTVFVTLSRGNFPYQGRTERELYESMQKGNLVPITSYRNDLNQNLVDTIHKALDPEPENRIQSAEEWIQVLKPLALTHQAVMNDPRD